MRVSRLLAAVNVPQRYGGKSRRRTEKRRLARGHKDTRMLDRVYARLPPELLRVRLLHALGR